MFDPSDLSQDKIMKLRAAAKTAWADDTRHERFEGHPMTELGQCYVTAAWLKHQLGGHVGEKKGHFFWVSDDKKYALDLVNDHFAFQPVSDRYDGLKAHDDDFEGIRIPESRKVWHPGPPLYKATTHHHFSGLRIKDRKHDGERTQRFIKRANAAYESL